MNNNMDKLRSIPNKSIEDQKKFLDLKQPRKPPFKFHWKMIIGFLFMMIKFMFFFYIYNFIFNYFDIHLAIWHGVLIVMITPIIINFILAKFNLEKSDMTVFLRGSKR